MESKSSFIKYPPVTIRNVWSHMWKGVRPHWFAGALTILGIAVANVFEVIGPLYYKKFFDVLVDVTDKTTVAPELVRLIAIVLALNMGGWVSWRIATFANSHFQAKAMAKLRQQAFDYLMHHSYTFFTNNFAGALVQRVNRYARSFERLADRLEWNIVPLVVRLVGVAIITWTIEPKLTFIIVGWAFLYMIVNYAYSAWRLKYNIKMAAADSRTTAVLSDAIANQNNIELFSAHGPEARFFQSVTEDQASITKLNWNFNSILEGIQAILIILVEFALFYFAIKYWQEGWITVGTFVLMQAYIIGLGSRLWDFSRIVRDFYESYADAKEMVEIMMLPHEIKDATDAKDIVVSTGNVEFKNVGFSFGNGKEVLNSIGLSIPAGQKVALVGPSGAGKTTFVRLLLRFYDIQKGEILIDGQDIKKVTLESLHKNIALVPQDPLLFHRTIMDNIRYGREGASDEEVIRAAKLAHCDEFINHLPKGYETYVGERGVKLSGGERQRVAIARAILKNAPILILDEATSSLDSHSEALIQDALDHLMKGRTTLVIAHRLSTIKKMDRIIVVEKGKIVEDGDHDSLVANGEGLYKKLWTLQAGGFIQ